MESLAGRRFGDYEVLDLLGQGGMGAVRGDEVGAPADIYSAGVIAYLAAVGDFPHKGNSVTEYLARVSRELADAMRGSGAVGEETPTSPGH